MGYSHYFEHTKVDTETWTLIKEDCQSIIDNCGVRLGNWEGLESPEITKSVIRFNGVDGGSHETFTIQKVGSNGFEFCKTNGKPYDLAVCACLLVYRYHSPNTIELSSDGNAEDWQSAIDLVSSLLGSKYVADLTFL